MRNDDSAAQQIAGTGWRQGSVLPPSLVERLRDDLQIPNACLPRTTKSRWRSFKILRQFWDYFWLRQSRSKELNVKTDLWVVVTQDCDLVHPSFEKEPEVELVRLAALSPESKDGNLHWGDNPRVFQFYDPQSGDDQILFETQIHDRARVHRRYLADSSPDLARTLDPENIKRLCRWISQRYVRAAFPDEFNRRIKQTLDKLEDKKLKKKGDVLSGIYMLLDSDDELTKGEKYGIIVWATMKSGDYEDSEKRRTAQELVDAIEAALSGCDGIEIKDVHLKSEQQVTLDDLRLLKRWDYDSLSLRRESVEELPPQT